MPASDVPLRLGIVGYGYWGPNVLRNLADNKSASVVAVADLRPERLESAARRAPAARLTTDPMQVIGDGTIDAVAIITPVSTHRELVRAALESGKHVLVAKPLCDSVNGAEQLVSLAQRSNLVLLVDHTFVYTPAVRKIKQLLDDGHLGELWYFDSVRVNLGLFQHDVNVVWDLATHDFSILMYLLDGLLPASVRAIGATHSHSGLEDVVYVTLEYEQGLIAHVHVNWLSPVKIRQTIIGGSKRMLVWNDLGTDEKLKLYDRGITVANDEADLSKQIAYRIGDVWIPTLEPTEALAIEIEHFLACIREGTRPITNGVAARDVLRLLEATSASLRSGGSAIGVRQAAVV